MLKVVLIAVVLVCIGVAGGAAFLLFWNIPAPTAHVERVLPDARFPR